MLKQIVLILLFSPIFLVKAQDLGQLGGPLLSLSGSVSTGMTFYKAIDRESARSPFSYFISGNPTLSIYGFDIPVQFTYRDQQANISNPFNRFSLNPRYKWVAVNAGKFTKTLSKYSLSGQVVKGAGIDLTPGKFRFSAVAGSLVDPLIELDTLIGAIESLPRYERNSFGGKIGYGGSRNFFDIMLFKAKDDIGSIEANLQDSLSYNPEENLIIGSAFKLSPFKWMSFGAEVSSSIHTANQQSGDFLASEEIDDLNDRFGNIVTLNYSTKLQFAIKSNVDFRIKQVGLGAEYERIDPYYKSLGAFYFREDYENMLVKLRFSLAKGKIRFNSRAGLQRNNLTNLRSETSTRNILSLNASFIPSQNLTMAARYSNFQTERSDGLVTVNDTLRFARANSSYGFTPRYSFGAEDRKSSITMSVNYQNLEDLLATDDETIKNYMLNLGYNLILKEKGSSIGVNILGNQNIINASERQRVGLNTRWTKNIQEGGLSVNASLGGFLNFLNQTSEGWSMTARTGVRYQIKKSTNLSADLNYIQRSGETGFKEIRSNIRASYRLPTLSTKQKNKNANPQNSKS